MATQPASVRAVSLDRETWRRFGRAIGYFLTSTVGGRARALLAILVTMLLLISALNVLSSYVGRDFMTAIERRDRQGFAREAALYLAVFACSTVAAVLYRFVEERLGLLWREWVTRRLVRSYLAHGAYYRLNGAGGVANPDQRITDDVRTFTTMTLSLLLLFLNGALTVLAFGGVLWTISVPLFFVALSCAATGSLLTLVLGRRLIEFGYSQADREADFRTDLVHLREHAESIALLHHERRIERRLLRHLEALTRNLKRIIAVNRNLGFFTTGYSYLIQVIPVLIVAPLFMRGEVEFGVVTQSAMAFSHLMGAFSLVVTQFPAISSLAVVLARLGGFRDWMSDPVAPSRGAISVRRQGGRLAWEALTLHSPRDGRVLVDELSLTVVRGTRLLVRGHNDTAKVALFRATAGIWDRGQGCIVLPGDDELMFLTERPYLPPGTLREVLAPAELRTAPSADRIVETLHLFGLERILTRVGGIDVERDWNDLLSLDEQQLLSLTRIVLATPAFAFLDRVGSALDAARVDQVLQTLVHHGITCIAVGNGRDPLEHYDATLELGESGAWTYTPLVAPLRAQAAAGGRRG